MKKIVLIPVAGLVALVVLLGLALGFGTKLVTSYGSATAPRDYAPAVRQMSEAQQSLANALSAQVSDGRTEATLSRDAQSTASASFFSQHTPGTCPIGTARYLDTYTLRLSQPSETVTAENLPTLLRAAAGASDLQGYRVQGAQVIFKGYRVQAQLSSQGTDATLVVFQVPSLQSPEDNLSAACYQTSELPLSALRSLQ